MIRSLLITALLFPLCLSGQGFALIAHGDYERATFVDHDINDFFRSYNAYYGGNMKMPFDTLGSDASSHLNFGGGLRFFTEGAVGFSSGLLVTYGKGSTDNTAVFQNDITTQTDFAFRDWTLQFDLGINIKQFLFLHGHMTGRFRKTVMDLGYIYQDGSYSLGNEYDILGVYSASTNSLDVGASVGLRLGPVYIPLTISFPTNFASDDGLLTLVDFEKRQIRWGDLPRDFPTWVDDPANIDLDTGFVRARSLAAMRISLGIEIWLGGSAKKEQDFY